jgi:hypothetical protein
MRASYLTPNRVATGLHGRKTGRGWFDYAPAERTGTGDATRPVWVAEEAVRTLLADAGATVAEALSAAAVVLVPTWGTTVAAAVAEQGLPADRTFGVDPLALPANRRVLAVTPAAGPAAARDAAAVLALGGKQVWVARDTAGAVAQRLLASMVSVAASIAERGIATLEDIVRHHRRSAVPANPVAHRTGPTQAAPHHREQRPLQGQYAVGADPVAPGKRAGRVGQSGPPAVTSSARVQPPATRKFRRRSLAAEDASPNSSRR